VIRNRLQSLIHRHNLILPKGKLRDKGWWEAQQVGALEKLQIRQELAMLDEMEKHKGEVDAELGRQSLGEVWGEAGDEVAATVGLPWHRPPGRVWSSDHHDGIVRDRGCVSI
jgi:hypothetical protein